MPEFPDWLRGLALIGFDGTDYVVIAAKSTGELYTLIQGEYSGTPVTVAVDDLGRLLAVLKGQFGGDLITVKVDSEGRLYSYVTDDIDQWGNILPGGFAELAARLGSVASYERRGQVVYADSFDCGLGGWVVLGDAGYTCVLDPTDFMQGGYSVHAKTHTDEDDAVYLTRPLGGFPADVGIGAALWAKLQLLGKEFRLALSVSDASSTHLGEIRGTVADHKLWYRDSGGSFTEFGSWITLTPDPNQFRFFKVAIDQNTDKYLYAVVDGQQFDLSAIPCFSTPLLEYHCKATFQISASAASAAEAYIDSFVMTTKETGEHI